jgi:ABC-type branched-subunit amino acid transport system permease subunit
MIVLGGMRKFWGPLVGVTIFVVAQDYLSSLTDNWMTAIGLLFVLIVLLFPKGILGLLARRGREIRAAVTGQRAATERRTATIESPPAPLEEEVK